MSANRKMSIMKVHASLAAEINFVASNDFIESCEFILLNMEEYNKDLD